MFCREIVADLKKARAADHPFPRVVFVHQGTVDEGATFFEKRWPDVPAIADPDHTLYAAFGVVRAKAGQVVGPRAMLRGMHSMLRGHFAGKPIGDVLRMPGAFLVHGGRIVWSQEPAHAGDHPDLDTIRALFVGLTAEPASTSA